MSDTGTDTGSEAAAGHSSPLAPRLSWPRTWKYFTAEWLTTVFTIVLASATVALVWTSIKQHGDAVDAIEATKRLAMATENAAADRRRTASAEFILKIDAMLDEHRYDRIANDIQSHDSNYHLPKYPNKADADVEEYITVFDDMGYFITANLIANEMAYNYFSYDVEKAWCNISVQETIQKERATDKSKTAQSDPIYANFERLAKEYLETDRQSCKDLDSAPAPAPKKKMRKSR